MNETTAVKRIEASALARAVPGAPTPGSAGLRPKIRVENLDFFYGQNRALKSIAVNIADRKVTAMIGPSGCGKTTLLRVFNRMYDLYPGQRATGTVLLDETNLIDPRLDVTVV